MSLPTLSMHQEGAVNAVRDWFDEFYQPFFYLGGYAGTGKSTILPMIIDALGLSVSDIAFCAPTGKAAKVMGEKLRAFGLNVVPTTIHSLIYIPKGQRVDVLLSESMALQERIHTLRDLVSKGFASNPEQDELSNAEKRHTNLEHDLEEALAATRSSGPSFTLNASSGLKEKKLIVVDEASMVGQDIASDLLSFGIPLLAVGDPGQLPPVRDEAGLTGGDPDYFLTEIHRQALDNPIIRLATDARNGISLKVGNYGDGVRVIERIKDDVTYDPDFAAQLICGTNKRRWMITNRLRKDSLGIKTRAPIADEPLIVCRNSKDPVLVNGEFVRVVESVPEFITGASDCVVKIRTEAGNEHTVRAYQGLFEEHRAQEKGYASCSAKQAHFSKIKNVHLDYGWVITAHKSQGSQWDSVIVHDESGAFKDDSAKWLYTAVTRAAKSLVVIR